MVKINGEPVAAAGKSVSAYLAEAGYDSRAVAVEVNEVILPKADYGQTILADGDVVEIVCFMGGGAR
ncbi:sulfur carrier protein ThiS [Selenomonas sp.]|uniref:sulfur carrier protein ThiS n=1 Tax=Selenomonas sp. TaxID=2053611 RepID=UPI0025D2F796|nr:sulfur carrier protein ThiS [Selenomonas sp.]MCI6085407.1 sulfur carrier protein ThiS [Selenomonas sp.]MDY3297752.1 sulfur carrier protein ThiS [Selenomonas sp.]MDY4416637.1 sulfur carrier protein ThiS [Selenomonas sp.]